jgi:hypothetical protein
VHCGEGDVHDDGRPARSQAAQRAAAAGECVVLTLIRFSRTILSIRCTTSWLSGVVNEDDNVVFIATVVAGVGQAGVWLRYVLMDCQCAAANILAAHRITEQCAGYEGNVHFEGRPARE